ncbi:hypothetical protein SNEBB_002655 [Seison nebaliae]|nr:hypothetical protein SNEBB_002655 [Seison nebaliae]
MWIFASSIIVGIVTMVLCEYLHNYMGREPFLFTTDELSLCDGKKSDCLQLAFLGTVYDLNTEKGRQHYGPDGHYNMFTGRDSTLAFVTGDFDKDLTDDISKLKRAEYPIIVNWVNFYEKHYRSVGRVIGRFYDEDGKKSEILKDMEKYQKNLETSSDEMDDVNPNDYMQCEISREKKHVIYSCAKESNNHVPRILMVRDKEHCIYDERLYKN